MMRHSLLVALVIGAMMAVSVMADTFSGGPSASFLPTRSQQKTNVSPLLLSLRAGAVAIEDDLEIESSDEEIEESEEESEDEEEEEEELDPKLAKITQQKAASMKNKMAKAAVAAAVKPKLQKKKKPTISLMSLFHIPYIVRVCLNPFSFVKMSKSYWNSLFDLKYLEKNTDSSQDLRSALEQKAKKSGGSSSRGKRKFKPGQAKTLSDLPQLNT